MIAYPGMPPPRARSPAALDEMTPISLRGFIGLHATFLLGLVLSIGAGAIGEEPGGTDPTAPARNRMVQRHLVERGIKDPRVLDAFRTVPRHKFLPPDTRRQAY